MSPDDPYDLNRFVSAQEGVYEKALAELKSGQKRTHWIWFIFPQIDGLGYSPTAKRYSVKSIEEARQYLNHPVLGKGCWNARKLWSLSRADRFRKSLAILMI